MLDHINHYWNACLVYNFLWLHHKPAGPNMMGTILDNSIISTDFIIINILHLLHFSALRSEVSTQTNQKLLLLQLKQHWSLTERRKLFGNKELTCLDVGFSWKFNCSWSD